MWPPPKAFESCPLAESAYRFVTGLLIVGNKPFTFNGVDFVPVHSFFRMTLNLLNMLLET